jgi:hypothetical protein
MKGTMSETNYGHAGNEGSEPVRAHHDVDRDERHYWRIWVALFFMFGAIAIYVLSDDLAFLPHLI